MPCVSTRLSPRGHARRPYDPSMLPVLPNAPHASAGVPRPGARSGHMQQRNLWNTSTQQERMNIKNFWLSLSEEDRKALLRIEKEAVLKKMKQQQKSSCSCTVCGRKRTAIEEELEVLYEGYYEELEHYANEPAPLSTTNGLVPDPLHHRRPHPLATPPPPMPHHHGPSHMHEDLEEEEYSDEEDEYSEGEEYSEDEELEPLPEPQRVKQGVSDFFNFGDHLAVKDNLLTVADDLLKNDGRKFIEMMEQLAERRMQRESRSQYEADNHSGYPPNEQSYNHDDALTAGDDFDDDEGSYDSGEEYDEDLDEDDETGGLTEEQRIQEGRRMFQIFAARMFEQRVLTAYREKVAKERQEQLLQDLVNEEEREKAKELKKQRDAQKRKDKKKQQQQAKAEEKARRDAEKAEEEARLRQAEEQKQEEQRRKKEEQRKKREEEKRKLEEEKARKEMEKLRRQQEEQSRREEAERKARELKSAEKARKEEARRREREERESREKEARERKNLEDKDRKDREAKNKLDKDARDREKTIPPATHPHPTQIAKRPSQMGMVAIPAVHPKQLPGSGISSSPRPLPTRPRQPSQQNSLPSSSPRQAHKASSPGSGGQQQQNQPKTILQKSNPHQASQPHALYPLPSASPLHHQPLQPPPGMTHPHQHHHPGAFGGVGPMGFSGFPAPHNNMMPPPIGLPRGPMPMYPQQGPPMGMGNRIPFNPSMNGMPGLPPGMSNAPIRNFGFDMAGPNQPPPGFMHQQQQHPGTPVSSIGQSLSGQHTEAQRNGDLTHSRQPSVTDRERFEGTTASQPIARPAPIGRPSSVKPPSERRPNHADTDETSKHLGSSALLDDTDDLQPALGIRRHSGAPSGARNISGPPGMGQLGGFGGPGASFGAPGSSWNTPNIPFGQGPGLGQPSWGSLPSTSPGINMGSWMGSNNMMSPGVPFGGPQHHHNMHGPPAGVPMSRPRAIRIAICQACRQLSSRGEELNDTKFHPMENVMRQIELSRTLPVDAPATLDEIIALCSTEGDSLNGGGELILRKDPATPSDHAPANAYAVRWESDQAPMENGIAFGNGHARTGLGEIGSPMPSKSSPIAAPGFGKMGGIGRGLNGLGAPGSGNNSVALQHPTGFFQNLGAVGQGGL
ncbi:uncharacterized protein K489DRAFT_392795 [Dissoconium aciculare CBS 342.82]|uniref:Stress response protein NST1 n=1 Tax=Dissoconium aciculare CBS 342.82 TaxID=1314786 RepID=A0A6J3MFH9_9PEZI|nr:uncharacterized protein K489DRAFT_392795 [Dissoconium aciculare CBS 342.82]KAF1826730.1 hypothetical protein K489DRAFT_392795 [Dissoconium aciculare CBS 342.82]